MRRIILALAITAAWLAALQAAALQAAAPLFTAPLAIAQEPCAPEQTSAAAAAPGVQSSAGLPEFKGRVQPRQTVQLSSAAPGRVAEVLVEEGRTVEAGELLLVLEGQESVLAELRAAQLESALAQQALDRLQREAGVRRAEAAQALALRRQAEALAADRLAAWEKPPSAQQIEQALANQRLALKQLEEARQDLRKAQQKFDNHKALIWKFVKRHDYKLYLVQLAAQVSSFERRYQDALEKTDELLRQRDLVELGLRRAALAKARAGAAQAGRELEERLAGADPQELELAAARLRSAGQRQRAAEEDLRRFQVRAPFAGLITQVNKKAGEWLAGGQVALVLADLTTWEVRLEKIDETSAALLEQGARARVRLDAYPGLELRARLVWVDLQAREEEGDVYFPARLLLESRDPRLRWGQTARVYFDGLP